MKNNIFEQFCKLSDQEQIDVMVDFYNYVYSIQQDEFKKRVGIDDGYD